MRSPGPSLRRTMETAWYIIAAIAFAAVIVLLIVSFMRDRAYLRKRGLNAMGSELREEVEQERAASMERRDRFREALDSAKERGEERRDG